MSRFFGVCLAVMFLCFSSYAQEENNMNDMNDENVQEESFVDEGEKYEGWFIGLDAGYTFDSILLFDMENGNTTEYGLKPNSPTLGVNMGYRFDSGLRLQAEVGYTGFDLDRTKFASYESDNGMLTAIGLDGVYDRYTLSTGIWYDIPGVLEVHPYVGFSSGVSVSELSIDEASYHALNRGFEDSMNHTHVALSNELGFGLRKGFELAEDGGLVELGFGYNVGFTMPDVSYSDNDNYWSDELGTFKSFVSQTLNFNVRVKL